MKKVFLIGLFVMATWSARAQRSDFPVIGYYASWSSAPEDIPYQKLTQINYSFATPNPDGSLRNIGESQNLKYVSELAKDFQVKVHIAFGGWDLGDGGGNDEAFEILASQESSRKAFVKTVLDVIEQYQLDGMDLDWEYPDAGPAAKNCTALVKELATALHAKNKVLSIAVAGEGEHGQGVEKEVFEHVDFIHIMAYDGPEAHHSSYDYAVKCLDYWTARGCPSSKLILGVPFYGKKPDTPYNVLCQKFPNAPFADQQGEIYYNGIETMKKKTKLAQDRAAGLLIWEISQDINNKNSLLKAIQDQLKTN
jgi:chitinase